MGQAKQRGTFEERKALAIANKAAEPRKQPVSAYGTIAHRRGKSHLGLLMAAALSASAPIRKP